MTYQEMQAKAAKMTDAEIADARFINNMIDRWSQEDRNWDTALWMEQMNRRNVRKGN